MSTSAPMNKTRLTLAVTAALAGMSMAQPAWSCLNTTQTVNVAHDNTVC